MLLYNNTSLELIQLKSAIQTYTHLSPANITHISKRIEAEDLTKIRCTHTNQPNTYYVAPEGIVQLIIKTDNSSLTSAGLEAKNMLLAAAAKDLNLCPF